MRENRPYGSEGGEGPSFPTPYQLRDFASYLSAYARKRASSNHCRLHIFNGGQLDHPLTKPCENYRYLLTSIQLFDSRGV
jgi:hypothetical protein